MRGRGSQLGSALNIPIWKINDIKMGGFKSQLQLCFFIIIRLMDNIYAQIALAEYGYFWADLAFLVYEFFSLVILFNNLMRDLYFSNFEQNF